jgi:hypothetical protein
VNAISADLVLVVAIWMGGAIVMVPMVGLTIRFAVVPLLHSVARLRERREAAEWDEEVGARLVRLEDRVSRLAETVMTEPMAGAR